MRVVRVPFAWELLRQALKLPEETQLRNVRLCHESPDTVEFVFEHPDFEDIPHTFSIPIATPWYQTEVKLCGCKEAKFDSWGNEKKKSWVDPDKDHEAMKVRVTKKTVAELRAEESTSPDEAKKMGEDAMSITRKMYR